MAVDEWSKRHPAVRAANAARVLGVLIVLIALLIIAVGFFSGAFTNAPALGVVILAVTAVIYLAPGIALLALAGGTRRGKRGPTITVLVLAIVIAALLWLGVVGQLWIAFNTVRLNAMALAPLGFIAIIAIAATLLAVYCVESLRLPNLLEAPRGFEMMTPMPTSPTDPDAH